MWFPDWPLRRPDVPPDRPIQILDAGDRVIAANPLAEGGGVRTGMRRRQAEDRCPGVVSLRADPGAEAVAFEVVVAVVEALVPRVEVFRPGLLLAGVDGAVRYYGGESLLAERVEKELEANVGPGARLGLASGPFAAQLACRAGPSPLLVEDDQAFLASLAIEVIDHEEMAATLRWLGITTLGELARLPRAAVGSRFGNIGLQAHHLASGEDRLLLARQPPATVAVETSCEEPVTDLEQAAFLVRSLVHRLLAGLAGEGVAPYRVEVEAEAADGSIRVRTWRDANPFDQATLIERIRWQLRAWVEGGGVPGGLVRLRLTPADLSGAGRQLGTDANPSSEAITQRAITRAQALVGSDQVLAARPQGGRDPAEQVQWFRYGEESPALTRDPLAPWPGKLPTPTPALVPPTPSRLELEWEDGTPVQVRLGSRWVPVLSWAGPWRRTGRWWNSEGSADRYQIVTSAGAFLCEVREGAAYLTGVYD